MRIVTWNCRRGALATKRAALARCRACTPSPSSAPTRSRCSGCGRAFNGNVCFDRPRGRTTWRDCFARLEREGLVSAYHSHSGAVPGSEPVPTHYFLTHQDKPFHLDYCFIPTAWTQRLERVTIAPFDEFKTLSDHRPVTVSISNAENK